MTNESTDNVTKNIISDFQNVPCSLTASMLVELENNKDGYILIDENYPDESTRITHKMYGVEQAWNFRIGKSLVNGCLSLVSTGNPILLSADDILDIKAQCQKILLLKSIE